jgi:protein tyrosine phosphatase (PTP) superfamily phosphohydrolase (DUF442 family)
MRSYVFERNLHPVVPGEIYRSAQPSGARLSEWIQTLSLRTVVNLRGKKSQDDRRWLLDEIAAVDRAGIDHVSIRMSADDLPPAQTLRKLVQVIDTAKRPLLLHCAAGAERSALASAVVVLLETGDLARARAEFALDKGFVYLVNPRLPRLLDAYAAWLDEQGVPSSPDRFRHWANHEYAPYFYRAKIEALDAPARIDPGTPHTFRFRVTNTSRETIEFQATRDTGVHLGAHLLGADGRRIDELRGGYRDLALAPGEATEIALDVPGVVAPGRYALRVDLVDEGVKWFESLGSAPLEIALEVESRP